MGNGMGVWGAVAGVAVLVAACGGKSGTSGSRGGPPPPGPAAEHFLTVSKSGSGTVRSSPAGIDCGTICSAILAEGTQMVLTPVPDPGWQFAGWGGGCSGLGGCAVKVVADTKVFVTFEAVAPPPPGKHNVTVTPSGAGAGRISSSPAGIDCGSSCTAQFDDGTKAVFNATPAAGSTFAGWAGACAGTATTCELSITTDLQIGAAFDGSVNNPPGAGWVSTVGNGKDAADVVAIATDPSGATIALLVDPSAPLPIGLRKLDAKGQEMWTRFFDGSTNTTIDPASSLATDGSGDIYLMWASNCADSGCRGTIDFGDGATSAAALVKFDGAGSLLWQKRLSEDGADLAVDAGGDAVVRSWSSTDPSNISIVKLNGDGSQAWTRVSRAVRTVGIDAAGNVLVGGNFSAVDDPIFGQTFASNGPVVVKLASADGSLLWAKRTADGTQGDIQGLGVDASSAIVAAGRIGGAFDFGGQHFDTAGDASSAVMFVFEPDGKERLARILPDTNEVLLAVDPTGRASLAGGRSATAAWVAMYDLAGAPLNSKDLEATGSTAALAVHSIAVSVDHNTALGGNFTGTVDFASGPTSSQGQQGFLANLGK